MKNISRKILSFVLACAMIVPMFIMPLQAETTIQSVTSPAGCENIEIRVTTDKEPLSYRVGDKVTFTIVRNNELKKYSLVLEDSQDIQKQTEDADGSENQNGQNGQNGQQLPQQEPEQERGWFDIFPW